jgi:hypothetical protein
VIRRPSKPAQKGPGPAEPAEPPPPAAPSPVEGASTDPFAK